jgi:hypothetical protein
VNTTSVIRCEKAVNYKLVNTTIVIRCEKAVNYKLVFELPALISLRVQGLKGQSCQILRFFPALVPISFYYNAAGRAPVASSVELESDRTAK